MFGRRNERRKQADIKAMRVSILLATAILIFHPFVTSVGAVCSDEDCVRGSICSNGQCIKIPCKNVRDCPFGHKCIKPAGSYKQKVCVVDGDDFTFERMVESGARECCDSSDCDGNTVCVMLAEPDDRRRPGGVGQDDSNGSFESHDGGFGGGYRSHRRKSYKTLRSLKCSEQEVGVCRKPYASCSSHCDCHASSVCLFPTGRRGRRSRKGQCFCNNIDERECGSSCESIEDCTGACEMCSGGQCLETPGIRNCSLHLRDQCRASDCAKDTDRQCCSDCDCAAKCLGTECSCSGQCKGPIPTWCRVEASDHPEPSVCSLNHIDKHCSPCECCQSERCRPPHLCASDSLWAKEPCKQSTCPAITTERITTTTTPLLITEKLEEESIGSSKCYLVDHHFHGKPIHKRDIKGVETSKSCLIHCSRVPGCEAFDWNRKSRVCYPFASASELTLTKSPGSGSVAGYLDCDPTPTDVTDGETEEGRESEGSSTEFDDKSCNSGGNGGKDCYFFTVLDDLSGTTSPPRLYSVYSGQVPTDILKTVAGNFRELPSAPINPRYQGPSRGTDKITPDRLDDYSEEELDVTDHHPYWRRRPLRSLPKSSRVLASRWLSTFRWPWSKPLIDPKQVPPGGVAPKVNYTTATPTYEDTLFITDPTQQRVPETDRVMAAKETRAAYHRRQSQRPIPEWKRKAHGILAAFFHRPTTRRPYPIEWIRSTTKRRPTAVRPTAPRVLTRPTEQTAASRPTTPRPPSAPVTLPPGLDIDATVMIDIGKGGAGSETATEKIDASWGARPGSFAGLFGNLVVAGGVSEAEPRQVLAIELHRSEGEWGRWSSALEPLPEELHRPSVEMVARNEYLWVLSGGTTNTFVLNSEKQWRHGPDLPAEMASGAVAVTLTGRPEITYVIGGSTTVGGEASRTCIKYDFDRYQEGTVLNFETMREMRAPRCGGHSAAAFHSGPNSEDEKILVVGGIAADSDDVFCCTAEIYSTGSNSWSTATQIPFRPFVCSGATTQKPILQARLFKYGNQLFLASSWKPGGSATRIFKYYERQDVWEIVDGEPFYTDVSSRLAVAIPLRDVRRGDN